MKRLFALLTALAVFFLNPVSVFAVNEDYLSVSNWIGNSNAAEFDMGELHNGDYILQGYYKILIDKDDNSFYLMLEFTDTSIDNEENVCIDFKLNNTESTCRFIVTAYGYTDTSEYAQKHLDIIQKFMINGADTAYPEGLIIIGIEFDNKILSENSTLSATLSTGRASYLLFSQYELPFYFEEAEDSTDDDAESSKQTSLTTTEKTQSAKTTTSKASQTGNVSEKTTTATSEASTKYTPSEFLTTSAAAAEEIGTTVSSYEAETAASVATASWEYKATVGQTEFSNSGELASVSDTQADVSNLTTALALISENSTEQNSSLSWYTILFFALSGGCALFGIVMMICASATERRRNNASDEEKNNNE